MQNAQCMFRLFENFFTGNGIDFKAPLRRNLAPGPIPMFPVDKQFLRLPS